MRLTKEIKIYTGAVAEWSKASDCKSLQPSVRIRSAPPRITYFL